MDAALKLLGPHVAYGLDRARGLGEDVARLAGPRARVLLICDPKVASLGLAVPLFESLEAAGHVVEGFTGLSRDPLATEIDAAAATARAHGATVVIGLGGGSALDVAKLAAAAACGGNPASHYALLAHPLPERSIATLAVPTTAGTGAEVTSSCVFSAAEGAKLWAWGEALKPDLAVLDPRLTVGLPPALTAATGVEALVHAIEAATGRGAHAESDAPALAAVERIRRHLPRAVALGGDLEARGAMLVAAALAGRAIDGVGTALAQALGHALGSLVPLHHGRAVGLGLAASLAWNAEAAPERHARVARAFGIVEADDAAAARALAPAFAAFIADLGLERSLAGDGLGPADAERLVALAMERENRRMLERNCRPVAEEDLRAIVARLLAHGRTD